MLTYQFECERSTKPNHQFKGLTVGLGTVKGTIEACDVSDAYEQICGLIPVPGHWKIHITRGNRSLIPRHYIRYPHPR